MMRRENFKCLSILALFLSTATTAQAAPIPIVDAAQINGSPWMPVANLHNGMGFTGDTYDPAISFADTQWRVHMSESNSDVQLIFDVGSVQSIVEMDVWNYAEGGGTFSGDRGTRDFSLSYSSDNLTYTSLGTQTLSRLEMLNFDPSSQHDVIAMGVSARYVKMNFADDPNNNININYGDANWWGLNEVRFRDAPQDNADFDTDNDVDGADFLIWQRNYLASSASHSQGDANADTLVDGLDLDIWEQQYGSPPPTVVGAIAAVPEPASVMLMTLGCLGMITRRRVCLRCS